MRTVASVLAIIVLVLAFNSVAFAQEEDGAGEGLSNSQVGVAALVGASFPLGNKYKYKITESWGFWVDIPIISTFHVQPSAILYRLDKKHDSDPGPDNVGVTDLSMHFKFQVPFPMWKIFFSALMGISNGAFIDNDFIHMHVGGNIGFGIRIVSNLDFVFTSQYKLILDFDQNGIHTIQTMTGLQFNF